MAYHNTNKESGEELKSSATQARHQEDVIMEYFKKHPDKEFTPFEIQEAVGLTATPITSIRRAITNLATENKLIKTDTQRNGQYGKKNYCWKLNGGSVRNEITDAPINNSNPDIYKILEEEKEFRASMSDAPAKSEVIKPKVDKQQKLFSE